MKNLIIAALILFVGLWAVPFVEAQTISKNITFAWDDPNVPNEELEYLLFMRTEGESYDYESPVLTIPYAQSIETGSSQASGTFSVNADPAEEVVVYFVLRAKLGDLVSEDSNEVSEILVGPPGRPMNFTITVIVNTP